jgi:1-acyl-sn-glycerol-3-phosphate acyltransferase
MPFGPSYSAIRTLATYSLNSFFAKTVATGQENVPKPGEGPIICVANHWSGAVDVSCSSSRIPQVKLESPLF